MPTVTGTPTVTQTPAPTSAATLTATPTALPTPDGFLRVARVPILMYHHIAEPPSGSDSVERDLSVSPAKFEQQLRFLSESGYETISTIDLVSHLALDRPLPAKPIIITFDDGYSDNYTGAFPLLQQYGYAATFYIITDYVDRGLLRYMTWNQIEAMADQGMEIGSHSRDHPDMHGKPYDYLVWQILGSQQTLEAHLNAPVRTFSFPSGSYDDFSIQVLESTHFWVAVTTGQGATHSTEGLFKLKRIRVRGGDSMDRFQKKLSLDW